jgi:hypothetical protein
MAKSRIKQRQSQKQTVIIKLDESVKRNKRKRRRPRAKKADGISITPTALPPNVIYQSSYNVPYPVFKAAMPQERTPFLQDVGQVGTEGRVEILPQPTKKEQLEDLTQPVPINRAKDLMAQQAEMPSQLSQFQNTEELNRRIVAEFSAIQRDIKQFLPAEDDIVKKTRRTKDQMAEARQMGREDIVSTNLGLYQFNNPPMPQIQANIPEPTEKAFKPYSPAKETLTESLIQSRPKRSDSIVSDITIPSDISSDISPLSNLRPPSIQATKGKGKGSWDYWLNRYEYLVGEPFDRKGNKIKLPQFKELVTKMETL